MGEFVDTFIVLGQVPGTDIVINFQIWLYCAVAVLAGSIIFSAVRRSFGSTRTIPFTRTLLHATQLHQRAK